MLIKAKKKKIVKILSGAMSTRKQRIEINNGVESVVRHDHGIFMFYNAFKDDLEQKLIEYCEKQSKKKALHDDLLNENHFCVDLMGGKLRNTVVKKARAAIAEPLYEEKGVVGVFITKHAQA